MNSIICVNDNLARWIKEDFPKYDIEASVIKNINKTSKLEKALKLYTTVVLPISSNLDIKFLKSIKDKSRIRLFVDAGCALECSSHICYVSFSKINKTEKTGEEWMCSKKIKHIADCKYIHFDIKKLNKLGFYKFKTKMPG